MPGEGQEGVVLPAQCMTQCHAGRANPVGLRGSVARTGPSLLSVQVYVSVDTTASRPRVANKCLGAAVTCFVGGLVTPPNNPRKPSRALESFVALCARQTMADNCWPPASIILAAVPEVDPPDLQICLSSLECKAKNHLGRTGMMR